MQLVKKELPRRSRIRMVSNSEREGNKRKLLYLRDLGHNEIKVDGSWGPYLLKLFDLATKNSKLSVLATLNRGTSATVPMAISSGNPYAVGLGLLAGALSVPEVRETAGNIARGVGSSVVNGAKTAGVVIGTGAATAYDWARGTWRNMTDEGSSEPKEEPVEAEPSEGSGTVANPNLNPEPSKKDDEEGQQNPGELNPKKKDPLPKKGKKILGRASKTALWSLGADTVLPPTGDVISNLVRFGDLNNTDPEWRWGLTNKISWLGWLPALGRGIYNVSLGVPLDTTSVQRPNATSVGLNQTTPNDTVVAEPVTYDNTWSFTR